MSLCRHYVRELRRSNLVPELHQGVAGPSTDEHIPNQFVSSTLRENPPTKHAHSDTVPTSHNTALAGETGASPGEDLSSSAPKGVRREDIRASAEKILYTYLLPGSEREIVIPQGLSVVVTETIEQEGRDDPEIFDAAKDYVFQAMERDAFPGFLRSKALGNIVPPSIILRLTLGLLSLFCTLWIGFILIFLDYSRTTRCWVSLLKPPFHIIT